MHFGLKSPQAPFWIQTQKPDGVKHSWLQSLLPENYHLLKPTSMAWPKVLIWKRSFSLPCKVPSRFNILQLQMKPMVSDAQVNTHS